MHLRSGKKIDPLGVCDIKILAIDQSSTATGYAIFVNEKLDSYSLIDLSKQFEKGDENLRVETMCHKIHMIIEDINPDIIVFEDVSLQTNVATLILLARIQGAIIQSALFSKKPYKIYKPSTWRKLISFNQCKGIKRKQLKQQALDYVQTKYNLKTKEDIAEAICIGSAFLIENGGITINGK